MNRDTRTFIWGLILLLIGSCCMGAAFSMLLSDGFHLLLVLSLIFGVGIQGSGFKKITKVTD